MQSLSLVTPAAAEPVSEAQARVHARIGTPSQLEAEDILLKLQAARSDRESFTQRQFLTATWRLSLGCLGRRIIELPKPPLRSVSWVKYYDLDNVQQTLASSNYVVTAPAGERAGKGFIAFDPYYIFPNVYDRPDAVQIEFVAGYGSTPASVPASLRSAILLVFGELYANREEASGGSTPNIRSADALCWPYRVIS